MLVRDYMTTQLVCMGPAATVRDVVRVMALHNIRHVPILDEQRHVMGVVGDRELRTAAERPDYWELRTREIMSHAPRTITGQAPLGRALASLCEQGTDVLLVLERGVLVGILTRTDFLRAFRQLLALDGEGSCVEVSLNGISDLAAAVGALHEARTDFRSAIVGRVHDDGDELVLFVRLGVRNSRLVERALAKAGLILRVCEEGTLTDGRANAAP